MKICRFEHDGNAVFGSIEDEEVTVLDGRTVESLAAARPEGPALPLRAITPLAPVSPGKIICVGRNYAAHAKELGNDLPTEPLLFLKPPSAVIACGDTIQMPPESSRVDFEGELALVIGRRGRNIDEREALSHIAGFTCANDVTARDLQKKDVQFTRGKGFDTFCPLGPWLVTQLDLESATLETRVNGERRQFAPVSTMIFSVPYIVAYISRVMTLEPGDVILTGTPEGVGPLSAGDTVEVLIPEIGSLVNRAVTASS